MEKLPPELQAFIDGLLRELAALKQENAELRRQLAKTSSTSSKPPSSDGLGKPPRLSGSLRRKSGKQSGGQAGHKGDTLRQTDRPDIVRHHTASQCAHCAAKLTAAMCTGIEKRQVFDMPEPRLDVTEHQAGVYVCRQCGGTTKAAFPDGVTIAAPYGPRIKAAAVYLNVQQLLPEDRVADVMGDVFGAPSLCPASVVAWGTAKANALQPVVDHIGLALDKAVTRHLDETGFRIGGKTQWLHVVSSTALTQYRTSEKRGDIPQTLKGGVVVHDHWKPYYKLENVTHALCNAHHLRELKALMEIEKEPWATKMFRLLVTANKAVVRARANGATELPERSKRRILLWYDGLIVRGLQFHDQQPPLIRHTGTRGKAARRPGHNLLIRLRDFKDEVLRFIDNLSVPFTNNQAEQDIRMMKVKMKISGGFRTTTGAETFATLRSVLSTARKQGWNTLKTLTTPPQILISNLSA